MSPKIENGVFMVPVVNILGMLTGDDKRELIDALCCEYDVMRGVCQQIVEGYTDRYSHGGSSGPFCPEPRWPLDIARRMIAKGRDEVVKRELTAAEDELIRSREKMDRLERSLDRLKRESNDTLNNLIADIRELVSEISILPSVEVAGIRDRLERIATEYSRPGVKS